MIAIFRMSIQTVYLLPATAPRQLAGQARQAGSGEPSCPDEPFQRDFRARADMADDLGGAQAADLAAGGERQAPGQAEQETRGIKVTRPGRVDASRPPRGGE